MCRCSETIVDLGRIFAEKFAKVFYSERIPFYGKVNETMIMYQLEALSVVLMRLSCYVLPIYNTWGFMGGIGGELTPPYLGHKPAYHQFIYTPNLPVMHSV